MKLTATQHLLVVHCLRVAAERFRHDAMVAQDCDLTPRTAKSFTDTFTKQSTDADRLADDIENSYEDVHV